jgi:hypothetical protein
MDQATHCLGIHAIDSRALLVAGTRLSRQSLVSIERSGNSIIRSRERLVLSRARLDRSQRRLLASSAQRVWSYDGRARPANPSAATSSRAALIEHPATLQAPFGHVNVTNRDSAATVCYLPA